MWWWVETSGNAAVGRARKCKKEATRRNNKREDEVVQPAKYSSLNDGAAVGIKYYYWKEGDKRSIAAKFSLALLHSSRGRYATKAAGYPREGRLVESMTGM